ncbi:hypothetical protein ACFOW4_00840 [Micromonospora sp. GCM10011542]|uniref:hypothetical protein n=1 Tax=Micromonospora sp. GCM10011542 TaxID=3317337 RepID=UPI00361125BD
MDQETVERLLDGIIVDPSAGPRPVVLLLTAVRAAPRPAELAGEGAALRGYRDALAQPTKRATAFHPTRRLAGFGIRATAAAVALVATGGVALAAATGTLPLPPHPSTATPPPPPGSPGGGTAPDGRPAPGPGASSPGGPTTPTPAAALLNLCRAYRADAGDNPGRSLDNPVLSELITAAGDRQRVGEYCDRVLAGGPTPSDLRPSRRPDVTPSRPGPPVQPPSVPPTGKPTATGSERVRRPTALPVPPTKARPAPPTANHR